MMIQTIVTALAILIILVFFAIQILSLVWMLGNEEQEKELPPKENRYPKVSLLLAARNEEKLIQRSLQAISKLNYPPDKLEILIGDDASTDQTAAIVREFIKDKEQFSLYHIDKVLGKGRGKANVLAQLAHHATGDIYFITDVDVKLPENWIREIVRHFKPEVGIVSGTTMCERGALFADMQSIDWLHFMGYIKAFAKVGVACTSVGNNMAVRAEAYWQTGGYEEIDFSITEDYKLFQTVTRNDWQWRTLLNPDSLGLAWYIPSLKEMLHQRKRWLIGARDLPLNWKAMIILYGLFLPALAWGFTINVPIAFALLFVKMITQMIFIKVLSNRSGIKSFSLAQMILYEFYLISNTMATAVFYFLPIKSVWKNRTYNAAYLEDAELN